MTTRGRMALLAAATVMLGSSTSCLSPRAPATRPTCDPGGAWADCTPGLRTRQVRWLAPDLGVEHVVFGIPGDGEGGAPTLLNTRSIPHVQGQRYGWMMSLRTGRDAVRVREELTMPAPPLTWGRAETSPLATISQDRRSVVLEAETSFYDHLQRAWIIDQGDPHGLYTLRLYVEDVLVGEATFVVGQGETKLHLHRPSLRAAGYGE